MSRFARFLRRFLPTTSRRRRQEELRREMAFHQEERTAELMAAGRTPREAAEEAQREFGPTEVFKEACRDAWGWRWWHDFRRDVAFAGRRMLQHKRHSVIVVATFAMCVSLTTFTLGLTDALLLNPGLYPEEERLVFLWEGDNTFASVQERGFFPIVLEKPVKESVAAFSDVAYFDYNLSHVNWHAGDEPAELMENFLVGPDYFETLRVQPVIGRAFRADEVAGEGARVVVLMHETWRRRFGRDPNVLGKMIRIDSVPHEVVGVMPADFVPPPETGLTRTGEFGLLLPLTDAFKAGYVARFFPFVGFNVVARLADGATMPQATEQIDRVKVQLFPERYQVSDRTDVQRTRMRHLGEELTRSWGGKLALLQGAALLMLVLGCVNIAGLVAGRNLGRIRELAVRAALGASRVRLATQLATETMVLSLTGGVLGIGLAIMEHEAARAAGMFDALAVAPRIIDRPVVLLGCVGLAALSGVAAGLMALWPLLRRDDLDKYLKQDARTGTTGRSAALWRDGLVVAQVALAVVLLVATGLLARSFGQMLREDLGFKTDRLLIAWIKLPEHRFDNAARREFMLRLDRELRAMPGVEMATLANQPPMNVTGGPGFRIEGLEPGPNMPWPRCNLFTVGLGFMDLLGVPVLRGRGFEPRDFEPEAPSVILVDQLFVDRHLSDRDPLGQRVFLNGRWWTIVGVAASIHYQDVTNAIRQPTVYQNFSQRPPWWFVTLLRTEGDPVQAIGPLRLAVSRVDPDIGAFSFETMDAVVERSYADRRIMLSLGGIVSGVALLLVGLGLYGSMSQAVAGRTREIGVRMALGADPSGIVRGVLRQGFFRFALGAGLGLAGSGGVARLIAAQLFATSPFEGIVYLGVLALLALAVGLACLGPARRAARVDPVVALRTE